MNVARSAFGMAVIGSTIYAVGGRRQYQPLPVVGSVVLDEYEWDWLDDYEPYVSSVEYLDVDDWLKEGPPSATSVSTSTMSWQIHKALSLRTPRCDHGMVRVGSCLVVVGGHKIGDSCHSVEALDTQRNVVWELREIQGAVGGVYNVVAISTGIILISVWYTEYLSDQDSGERLSLVDMNSMCFAQLIALGKASMLTRGGAGFNGRTQQFEKLQNENRELTREVASLNDEKHKLEQELDHSRIEGKPNKSAHCCIATTIQTKTHRQEKETIRNKTVVCTNTCTTVTTTGHATHTHFHTSTTTQDSHHTLSLTLSGNLTNQSASALGSDN